RWRKSPTAGSRSSRSKYPAPAGRECNPGFVPATGSIRPDRPTWRALAHRFIEHASCGVSHGDPGLEREQRALAVEAARIAREAAVRTDDAMAGNDDRDRIAAGCGACGAYAAR